MEHKTIDESLLLNYILERCQSCVYLDAGLIVIKIRSKPYVVYSQGHILYATEKVKVNVLFTFLPQNAGLSAS